MSKDELSTSGNRPTNRDYNPTQTVLFLQSSSKRFSLEAAVLFTTKDPAVFFSTLKRMTAAAKIMKQEAERHGLYDLVHSARVLCEMMTNPKKLTDIQLAMLLRIFDDEAAMSKAGLYLSQMTPQAQQTYRTLTAHRQLILDAANIAPASSEQPTAHPPEKTKE